MSLGTILLFIAVLLVIGAMPGRTAHGRAGSWPGQGALEALIIITILLLLGIW